MKFAFPVLTAAEAAAMIQHGQTVGFSGFTPAGAPKAIPKAIAERAVAEHAAGREFQIGVLTGASTGDSLDGALARADAISFRTPYQSNAALRASINSGQTRFFDMHLSLMPQAVRYGFLGPMHWVVVEAADITAGGGIVLSSSVGAAPTFCTKADRIIIELNHRHPPTLLGMHDIYEPADPPSRREIPIFAASDRVGSPVVKVDPAKIVGIVETDLEDEVGGFVPATPTTEQIGNRVAEFLAAEIVAGRIPQAFLPIQSGVGDIANSVLGALGTHPDIPAFEMYTEVLQDSVIKLMEQGRVTFASTCSLTLSNAALSGIYANLNWYRNRILMRPQEISNHPEVIRRLGIISMNTAIEVDIFGNVNSTHIMGRQMMNGIGGSGDFTRNAYLSIFSCPSTAKGGKISTIVPLVSHVDHSEHSVQIIATEWGIADLRGRSPFERAYLIIENCAHPDFRETLKGYLAMMQSGHTPHTLAAAYRMHDLFIRTGDMRGVQWTE
ncbi:MAG TPA: acetyl-CoA hydrolase/transferase family protein [Bryobacteraceae bacterium]|nr:acetyl-CoA hydrolase/transferase family protein [Bryobacteraceae bacterium]